MKIRIAILVLLVTIIAIGLASLRARNDPPKQEESELLVSLGINNNPQVTESSGLAYSRTIENSIWTLNDSGHANDLLLLKTDGTLQATVSINGATNVDWEAMAGFKVDKQPYLIVADVGDNLNRRKTYQLYLLREPDLSADLKSGTGLPIKKSVNASTIQFTYEDGPKNCEAIGVDVVGKKVWLVEKVYYDTGQKSPPGVYSLPLSLPLAKADDKKQLIAKRVADFPPRNVTGMDFSPDGKRLIIRNYVSAHLYTRDGNETWESVVSKTKPTTIVLPLQRQGEAICFSPDSESVIVTSEFLRQPIWQVNLSQPIDRADAKPEKAKPKAQLD
jgi:hypothetical protein